MTPTNGIIPEWVLSEKWAVGRDPLNWKLYRRMTSGKWKCVGYYGSVEFLIRSLHNQIEKTDDKHCIHLIDHLEECLGIFKVNAEKLYDHLGITDTRNVKGFKR